MKKIYSIIIIVSLAFFSCDNATRHSAHEHEDHEEEALHDHDHDAHHDEDHDEDHEGHSHEGEIYFSEHQMEKIEFAVEPCVVGPFGQVIKVTGRVSSLPSGSRTISSLTEGIVSFSSNNIVEGSKVSAGQVLFYIDDSSMSDNNLRVRYVEAENEYNRAKAEYERKKALADDDIVSERELLAAKTEYLNAEAVYNNMKSNFSSGRQAVTAPISGHIEHMAISNGQYVSAGETLFSIVSDRSLSVRAEVPARYAKDIANIQSANFRAVNSNKTYTLDELKGKLVAYGRSVDVDHPLLPVTFQIDNPGDLMPGEFVETYISTKGGKDVITVPTSAIVEEMGAYFVFVKMHEEMFSKVPVTLGATDGVRTAIVSGLDGDESIVTKGAIFVKLSQGGSTLDAHAGHVH
ncbi:MAG: efflux RND transporter periplasmic adaptor subunit [Bacteroidales bacterium]|nr:efflux RND transporter periplasmic adaptor subunit [Bacteroidales bacterium]